MTTLHALDDHDLSNVRIVLFSGEVMPLRHLHQWMDALPQATFVNLWADRDHLQLHLSRGGEEQDLPW